MALADQKPAPTTTCSVGAILRGRDLDGKPVPDEDIATFTAWLGTPDRRGLPAGEIFDAVKAEGYRISYQQINRHRGARCGCSE